MKRADQNGDGKISQDEVPEQAWARLGKLDTNNDGAVTKEEMAAGMSAMRGAKGKEGEKGQGTKAKGRPGGAGPEALFSRYDEDEDGKIGESDVPAEVWGKLRNADTDADGLVSKEELVKVYQERAQYGS